MPDLAVSKSCRRLPVLSARAAFTLMEVLMAIALIAAMAGFAAMGVGVFSDGALKSRPPDRVFLSALKLAQLEAVSKGRHIELSYHDGYFLLQDRADKSVVAKVWLTPELEAASKKKTQDIGIEIPHADVVVCFIPRIPEALGTISTAFPDENLKTINVSPDGVCTPVNVSFSLGGEEPFILKIDPFSASPMEEKK